MPEHTLGPWFGTWNDDAGEFTLWMGVDPFSNPTAAEEQLCWEPGVYPGEKQWDTASANIDRIVAAVNACAGIPTEALEAGVIQELVKGTERVLADAHLIRELQEWGCGCEPPGAGEEYCVGTCLLRSALAKLQPQREANS